MQQTNSKYAIEIFRYSLGQMQANCYLICRDNQCILLDPGDEADFLLEKLLRTKLELVAIIATHGHFDHLMAVGEIQASFDVPLYISQNDQFLLTRLESTAKHFLGYNLEILPIKNIKNIADFRLFNLQIIETPGHTPGSICLYNKDEQILFSGDTLFKEGIGRYDFSYSNKNDLYKSLRLLLNLPKETKLYPGHGDETTIGEVALWLKNS